MSLNGLLWRYLLTSGALVAAIALAWLMLFGVLINMNVVLPANTARRMAGQVVQSLEQAGAFDPALIPHYYRWARLRADGAVVAYTFGEALNETVFCTHIEKAFADVRGAYPTINREFAANALSSFRLINREEDTGSEGLRKAKESYYPSVLLPKYRAVYKG